MKKVLLIVIAVCALLGCERSDYGAMAKSGTETYNTLCIDGVEYVRVWKGAAPHFKQDGTLYLCRNSQRQGLQ